MTEMSFRSLLASLHPNADTTPLLVGAVFPLFVEFKENGANYGLSLRFGDSAPLFPKVRLRLRNGTKFIEVLSRNEILSRFDDLAGQDLAGLKLLGGSICASRGDFLLITTEGCAPYGEETKINFVLRDIRAEWQVLDYGGRLFLLAPRFFERGKDDFMSAIVRKALEASGNKGRFVGGESSYLLGFNAVSGVKGMWLQTNREILPGSRIEVDGRTVLEMVRPQKVDAGWIAYFEARRGNFDLAEEYENLGQINVRLVLRNNALETPEPYEASFDIDVNESFREGAKYFLSELEAR